MPLKYGLLCLVLSLAVLFFAIKSYDAWTQPVALNSEKVAHKKSEVKTEKLPLMVAFQEPSDTRSFGLIAEKNMFNPERRDFPSSGTGSKALVRPQITLCGVVISKDYQAASILYPGRPRGSRERDQVTMKLGENIGGYKLAKITPESITLEAAGDSFEVPLYDKAKQRSNIKTGGTPSSPTPGRPTPNVLPPQPSLPRPASPIPPAPVIRPIPPASAPPVIRPPASPVVRPSPPSTGISGRRSNAPGVRVPPTPFPPAEDDESSDEEGEE